MKLLFFCNSLTLEMTCSCYSIVANPSSEGANNGQSFPIAIGSVPHTILTSSFRQHNLKTPRRRILQISRNAL
jgi:hypothetical protein